MSEIRIFVGGLNPSCSKDDLQELFKKYDVAFIWVARTPPGFAFISLKGEKEVEEAIKEFNGIEFQGGRISVERARGGRRREERRRDSRDRRHSKEKRRSDSRDRKRDSRDRKRSHSRKKRDRSASGSR